MDQEKTYKWVQDRIHDLHAGTLSAEDRIRMNELAKTDPFVRDAMEGYESNTGYDHSLLLKIISDRIRQKNSARRTKIIPLSKGWLIPSIAASLVLILATWVVFYYVEKQGDAVFVSAEPQGTLSNDRSTEVHLSDADSIGEKVSNEPSNTQGMDAESNTSKSSGQQGVNANLSGQNNPADKKENEAKKLKAASDIDLAREDVAADVAKESEGSKETAYPPPISKPATVAAERAYKESPVDKSMTAGAIATKTDSKKDEGYYANQISPSIAAQRITGIVKSQNGENLYGAQISVQNTNLVTSTDYTGKFELYLPESTTTIDVGLSGYKDTSLNVAQGAEDIGIILRERDFKVPSKNITELIQSDYISFSTYVKTNTRIGTLDQYTVDAKLVTLEFKVTSKGRPENIQLLYSAGDKKYSTEAIRLLKNGPGWTCSYGQFPCLKQYTFYFKGRK
ncbi:MAG: carboxypeptidase-like regulatory domain-containing protein [Saprospiraceae bacterium]